MVTQGVTAYSFLHATVRALYATMLSPVTWRSLIQAKDLKSTLSVLSETVYAPYLQIERELLKPRRVVYQIRQHLADVYEKIIRLTPEPGHQLMLWLWRLYEVDNLKAVIRGVEAGASWDQVLFLLNPVTEYAELTVADMEKMVRRGDVMRAIELTRHTPYYETLSHAADRYRAERSLFPLEVALDMEYSRELWQNANQLTGLDREHALKIVGSILDVDNLLWAIRYRTYHHLSEEEIINYTLPFGYQVQDEDIRAIAAGANITQVVKRVYPDLEGVEPIAEDGTGLEALELILQRHIVRQCRDAFVGYPFQIGIPTAYLILNEYEIRDLTALIEAKTSHLATEIIKSMLVLQPPARSAEQR